MANAIRFHETGGPEVLRWETVEVEEPGAGEVLVRHHAVGLNFADNYYRTGLYPVPLPNGMGVEASGVIEEVGPGVPLILDSGVLSGADVVTALCERLLAAGVPGLHFYTMNQSAATLALLERLGRRA